MKSRATRWVCRGIQGGYSAYSLMTGLMYSQPGFAGLGLWCQATGQFV
jgi:hypothetical protein